MPDWISTVAPWGISALIFAILIIWINRSPPPAYRDPGLSESERNEDFWDKQW